MEFRDYYATLGVPKTATEKDIKQAFRRLARKHHPDVNPGDAASEARFKEASEAYEVLSDAESRKKYDELGANWKAYEQAQRAGGGAPFGAGGPFGGGGGQWSYTTGRRPGGRPGQADDLGDMFGDASPFSDFFKTFFGGAGEGPPQRPGTRRATHAPEQAQHHEVPITLEEAFTGATRRVTLSSPGRGDRTLEVRFPAGIRDGQRVRAASDGGDVYFRVRLQPHGRVERRGDIDLAVRVGVSIPTAVLGGEVDVLPLVGRPIRMRVPPGTTSGRTLRIRGQGMPTVGKPDTRGDLLVTVDVQVPTTLSAEERTHYEALAALEVRPAQPA